MTRLLLHFIGYGATSVGPGGDRWSDEDCARYSAWLRANNVSGLRFAWILLTRGHNYVQGVHAYLVRRQVRENGQRWRIGG